MRQTTCSIRQAGLDFANSGYRLWHANRAGRDNLCNGIAPPDSGHPKFNKHADAYFGLRESLEKLLSRPVDLVMTRAIRNPYFLESVNASKTLLYAA